MKKHRTHVTHKSTGGRLFKGVVVKAAMTDTCTVEVVRYFKHPKYQKYLRRSKRYLVHDKGNQAEVGQKVTIKETRPLSKRKHFVLATRA